MRIHLPVPLFIFSVFLLMVSTASAQDNNPANTIPEKSIRYINSKYAKLTASIDKQSAKLLKRMRKKEAELHNALTIKDSAKAAALFSNTAASYQQLQDKLNTPVDKTNQNPLKEYLPNADSLSTGLSFVQQLPGISPGKLQQAKQAGEQVQALQAKLQRANEIQTFIRDREQLLKTQLAQYGLGKQLLGINKEVYYFQERLQEYKNIIADKNKLEQRAIAAIRDLPAFKSFFRKNSTLAQLFRMPGPPSAGGTEGGLAGLQTRAQVQQLVQERLGSSLPSAGGVGGGSPDQYLQQQVQQAQAQLNQLKDKVNQLGGGNSDMTQPDFRPDKLHNKTFLQHLEYSLSFQTSGTTNYLPTILDIAALVGFKWSEKLSIGAGLSYKVGLGRGWNHIALSNQGVGIRTYISSKLKGSFWLSGGFEWQYMEAFKNFQQIKDISLWNRSALAGIEKRYKIGRKKEGKMQVLYDFLAGQQKPAGKALVFRIGWGF